MKALALTLMLSCIWLNGLLAEEPKPDAEAVKALEERLARETGEDPAKPAVEQRSEPKVRGEGMAHGDLIGKLEAFKSMDADGDGKFSPQELAALQGKGEGFLEAHPEIKAHLLHKFDQNGNGALDPDEMQKLNSELVPKLEKLLELANSEKGRDFGERMQQHLAKFDTDGDGKLNETERQAMMEAMKKFRGDRKRP